MPQFVKRQRYRVDGWAEFLLVFLREGDGTYVIDCEEHPDNPHGGGVTDHHLYSSNRVCVASGREPRSLDRAVAIAHVFMNGYAHWCRTGRRGRTGGRVSV
jgi:hypothetical protein